MNTNFKLCISSALLVLSFLGVQAIEGMEGSQVSTIQGKRRCGGFNEEILKNPLEECSEIMSDIMLLVAADWHVSGKLGELKSVCKLWQCQIKKNKAAILELICPGLKLIYPEFLKGTLIYKNPNTKAEIKLPIKNLVTSLNGMFDLSKCDDMDTHLSISTGYWRKKDKEKNANKIEIWLIPQCFVKEYINATASHFQEIFPVEWPEEAPVGIFWTWGNCERLDYYDYLANKTMKEFSAFNLYSWLDKSSPTTAWACSHYFDNSQEEFNLYIGKLQFLEYFTFSFN